MIRFGWMLVSLSVCVCVGFLNAQTPPDSTNPIPRAKIRFSSEPPPRKTKRVQLIPFSAIKAKTEIIKPKPKKILPQKPEPVPVRLPVPVGAESSELPEVPQIPEVPHVPDIPLPPDITHSPTPPSNLIIPQNTLPGTAGSRPEFQSKSSSKGKFHRIKTKAPRPLPALPHPRKQRPLAIVEKHDIQQIQEKMVLLDLLGALDLIKGKNLRMELAEEKIREAYARHLSAKVLWLPTVNLGLSYNKHEGTLQASDGQVIDVSRSSLETGLGAFAVGAGTVMQPGLSAQFHLKDAWFAPKIAKQRLYAQQMAASAETKEVMRDVSLAYLELWTAHQSKAIAEQSLKVTKKLADLTEKFAKVGEGPQADADRSRAELAVRKNAVWQAEEDIQVASARLSEILRIKANTPIGIKETNMFPLDLIPKDKQVGELIAQALSHRPELSAYRHLVEAAMHKLKREKCSPWIPSVVLAASYGGFGGSPGTAVRNFNDRFDLDAGLYWQVRNMGFGEKASRKAANSRLQQAKLREMQLMDKVAREVVEQHSRVMFRQQQIDVAKDGLVAAVKSLQHNWARITEGEGLPIEVLQSIRALDQAQREYLRTVSSYNRAQLELQWVLGWPE